MRKLSCCGLATLACALLWLEQGSGAPVQEVEVLEEKLTPFSTWSAQYELNAQEETRVIASGADLFYQGLYVFDADGNCVAWDDFGGMEVREDCGVVFVPPTQGTYRVEVRSFFQFGNEVRIVVR